MNDGTFLIILTIFSGVKYSKSKVIYEEVDERAEKWIKRFHFLLMRLTLPATMLPNGIISYVLYFATDLGSDAFRLPFPIWFAHN